MKEIPLWRQILKQNFTSFPALFNYLELEPRLQEKILLKPSFILNLPLRLAQKIKKNCLDDPILKQFVPLYEELISTPNCKIDPVEDCNFQTTSKLLQKYASRSLFVATGACAMHCRYCFRRNYPYEIENKGFDQEIEKIASDPSQKEVILSGGDPLSLPDERLGTLLKNLSQIPHLEIIRFHTRFPIGIPERIDDGFLKILESCKKSLVFILHCNHPDELDLEIKERLKGLRELGIPLLNQSVLLKGVNDSAQILEALSWKLLSFGIMPYYLHQLDNVLGASHFEVSEGQGKSLIKELSTKLPGYLVPKYVKEISGKASKTNYFWE